jgi:hypothetical protein
MDKMTVLAQLALYTEAPPSLERTGMVSVARGRLELRDGEQLRRMVEMV